MKPNTLIKIGQWFFYLLMALSVVLVVVFYINNGQVNPDDSIHKQMNDFGSVLNMYVIWAYILVGIAALLSIVFPLIGMIGNPRSGLKTLISIVILAAVLFIAYSLGSDEFMNIPGYTGDANSDPQTLKLVDMGIFTMYIMLAGAILAMGFSTLRKLIK